MIAFKYDQFCQYRGILTDIEWKLCIFADLCFIIIYVVVSTYWKTIIGALFQTIDVFFKYIISSY